MNRYAKYYGLLFLFVCSQGFALPPATQTNDWQCTTHDKSNKQWSARNIYKKAAINLAFAQCKKESKNPASCRASAEDCEGFNQGVSTKPEWQCTALDRTAAAWESNVYAHRDDAALAAKAYCKEKSSVPDTCYINLVTCSNANEGEQK